jgi:hypothetical protein
VTTSDRLVVLAVVLAIVAVLIDSVVVALALLAGLVLVCGVILRLKSAIRKAKTAERSGRFARDVPNKCR